ncbi:MAG: acyl-CoA dehydrogenase [Alphaproteobacteria bacterium]|nr:MAG: acyl-CoA dehydrogenase [Alphaproteobacteria bacterium]
MSDYQPPIQDMLFILHDVLGFEHDDLDRETTEAILDEAAKLAVGVLAPLNKPADEQGAKLVDGNVKTADGFKEAYATYCEGGWNAVPFDPEYGGQGLPWALAFPVQEMWQGANMSFGLCPLLNQGTVEAISSHGSDMQKGYYLPKLISGEWTGTMNLTESQAGSDLGLLRAKAEKQADGSYKISGQKIFITYGDHDMAENIIHLVLARITDAPDDVRGISLFVVPKILENGDENTVECIGLEHKLGIHASPTCTMDFDGAIGELIGEEHNGLKYMFTMMNNARLCVGLQGVAIAERAYQHALAYANERVQGKSFTSGERVVITHHGDVRRMLLDMKARVAAGRIMAYSAALELDKAMAGDGDARARVDFLTPIVKGWCTDMAVDVASTGIQIHGGMGFIEETGAAQYYRDARILPIYEGTNGIQAADFVFRKVLRDEGALAKIYIREMDGLVDQQYLDALLQATDGVLALGKDKDMDQIAWLSAPYLKAFSLVYGGAMIGKLDETPALTETSLVDVQGFYRDNILPFSLGFLFPIRKVS